MSNERKNIRPGLDIAVIGMAGRFPGADNLDEFWQNLQNGIDSITFFTEEELKSSGEHPDIYNMPNYVRAKPILEDSAYFDASFFGYTPKEVEIMDPQMRVLHECAWHALEEAGYDPDTYKGAIGIYTGAQNSFSWQARVFLSGSALPSNFATFQLCNKDHLSTRISYKLNLTGPSFTLETQCSTSMVAIHVACQALLAGECDMALAGGVTITVPQKVGYLYEEGMISSPDGHVRSFDAKGKGSIFGEGAGIVVLKPIEEAIADGDNILAVIKSSFINNDGNKKVSYAAPSVEGLEGAVEAALELAQVRPESISYVECHGTATPLGDQIEIEALKLAFDTDKRHFCGVGSVKSNIGHVDNAAGVGGFIKTVLAIKHRLIPPSLHFDTPNPMIDFENSPFFVNTELREWKNEKYPLRAGVNSFGVGGTNAHVILEEPPEIWSEVSSPSRKYQLLLISAKTDTALDKAAENLGEYLKKKPDISLADAAYTLQVGRKAFNYRKAVVCSSVEGAIAVLSNNGVSGDNTLANEPAIVQTYLNKNDNRSVYFMFSGLGSQYVNMGLDLYKEEPVFREEIDRCFTILQPLVKEDLKNILYPASNNIEESKEKIKQSEVSQILLFVFEYALARLLMKWGIKPHAVIGYSFGEYTAACIAGVFSLEDALKLIVYRGRLVQEAPEGAMLSVPVTIEQLKPLLNNDISVAVDNGPSCIVSGAKEDIDAFAKQLKKEKYLCIRLDTSHAVHSKLMEPILKKLEEKIGQITLNEPQIPFISNATGKVITEGEVTTPSYWSRHLRETVRFAAGVKELVKESGCVFIEIGPGWDLSSLVLRHIEENSDQQVINPVKHPKKTISDVYYLMNKIAWLWLYGIKIEWSGFYSNEKRRRIPLPKYPFERERYWIDDEQLESAYDGKSKKPLSGKIPDIADWFHLLEWERSQFMSVHPLEMSEQSCWLVFSNELDFCAQFVKRLVHEEMDVIIVEKGSSFSKSGEQKYTVNPQNNDDYYMLMDHLQKINKVPVNIVHLWGISNENYENLEREILDNAQDLGLYSLLYLTQAIAKLRFSEKLNIYIVTNDTQEIIGNEKIFPEKATVFAVAKTVQQQYSNIKCRCIDIILPEGNNRQGEYLIDQLWDEFSHKSSDTLIAYRGNYRWVESYKPVRLEEIEGSILSLKEKGVYLITGGLGEVGGILGKYLVSTFKAKLILLGRTTLPPRSEWKEYITTHKENDDVAQRISKVLKLEEMGGEVLTFSVDIADEERMKCVISEAEEQFGPINGIIHGAGILEGSTYLLLDAIRKEHFQKHFQPKVYGTLVLHKIFKDRLLDFCLLMSSPASILGGLGFSAYSSANLFMDTLVYRINRENRTRWISVNWGDWEKEDKREKSTSIGDSVDAMLMEPEEGVETFRRILKYCRLNQIVVSAGSLQDRIDQWIKLEFLEAQKKMDKKKSGSSKQRPNLVDPYEPPGNNIEETIVDIWIELFGYEKIGVHDNFFELGGDSLILLQLASKLNEAGFKADIQGIFQSQTISNLALLVTNLKQGADKFPVTGSIPLTPFQRIFFETSKIDRDHHNHAVMIYLDSEERFDEEAVKTVFQKIQEHHDVLRIIYKVENGNMLQIIQELEHPLSLQVCDFRDCENGLEKLEDKAKKIRSSLSLEKGPLMRLGLFYLADGVRLLIVIHRLIMDDFSWRILLEDIDTLFQQYKKGEELELPPKSDSFKGWAEKLSEYTNGKLFLKEKNFWAQLESTVVHDTEKYFNGEKNNINDSKILSFSLNEEDTKALLTEVNNPFGTEINEVLLTALGLGMKEVYGYDQVLIALEYNGREELLKDIDISRTIGNFTWVYPVILDLSYENDLSRQIIGVKECLRKIPNKGIGHGILKYSESKENKSMIEFKLNPQICVKLLNVIDENMEQESFKIARNTSGDCLGLEVQREYALDISTQIVNKQLTISFSYNKKQYKPGSVETLLANFKRELDHIIAYCSGQKGKELTPSDLTYKNLSMDELERLKQQYSIEDIYRLTPTQEGMYFHSLLDPSSFAYFVQKNFRLNGELDISYVEKSLNELFKRYEIFRTVYIHEGFYHPLQIVLKDRRVDFQYEDISKMDMPEEKEMFIKEFREKDKKHQFNLCRDVLMRVTVIKLDSEEYEFIWSNHHILMDGWCINQIISEFLIIYKSYIQNRAYTLPQVQPYRTYIKWLEEQDKEASENYWKEYLEDYTEPANIPSIDTYNIIGEGYRMEQHFSLLNSETTMKMQKMAEKNRVTLNIIIRTIWGIILGKYNGKQDVVFGAVVTGRPADVEGMKSIIGLFINMIPVRIMYTEETRFNDLLKKVQEEAIKNEIHYYYPLAEIQSGSLLKQNLFDNFITFDQYPTKKNPFNEDEEAKDNKDVRIKIVNREEFEQSNYNFNLIVSSGDQIELEIKYNANVIDSNIVKKMALHIEEVIDFVLENDSIEIGEIKISHALSKAKADIFREMESDFRL